MTAGLWKMDSGLAAARRPGMTPPFSGISRKAVFASGEGKLFVTVHEIV
jgi:hypothetical protein